MPSRYRVQLARDYIGFAIAEIEADSPEEAGRFALNAANTLDFSDLESGDSPDEIVSVIEI